MTQLHFTKDLDPSALSHVFYNVNPTVLCGQASYGHEVARLCPRASPLQLFSTANTNSPKEDNGERRNSFFGTSSFGCY